MLAQGRLVSDGIIRSKEGPNGRPAPPASATPEEERRILERLAKAEAEGTLLFALPHGPEGCAVRLPRPDCPPSRAVIAVDHNPPCADLAPLF